MNMHLAVEMKRHAEAPEIVDEQVVFSYQSSEPTRRVGIAFEHENFRTVHPFIRNRHKVFVLSYPIPPEQETLVYRLVVDGIWQADPRNRNTIQLPGGHACSVFQLPREEETGKKRSTSVEENRVVFRYPAETDGQVTVAGNFNHWDPFMHRLSKDSSRSDAYSLSISLPPGTYYYYFVVNGRRVLDPRNPRTMRSNDGHRVSVIELRG